MGVFNVIKNITKLAAVVCTLLYGVTTVGGPLLLENQAAVNRAFNIQTSDIVQGEEDPNEDTQYFKSVFNSVKEAKAGSEAIAQEVMEEGATLVKNENNALPLKKGAKISFYSASSVDPVIAGTGSSGTSNILPNDNYQDVVDLKTAFEGVDGMDITVNPTLWNFYKQGNYSRQKSGAWGAFFSIRDAAWDKIPEGAKTGYNDAAIFVLSRRSGEGNDMGSYYADDMIKKQWNLTNDVSNGNYLALSPSEISVLKGLKEQKDAGELGSIIILMNTANPVQCDFVDDAAYGVDAMLWCGNLGDVGSIGVANIMAGKVNPSGKLSDTFWKYHAMNPVAANFAIDQYNTGEWTEHVPKSWLDQEAANNSDDAMRENMIKNSRSTVYAEGIYVGYRYTETRYEDYIFGRMGVGEFDYYDNVSYPFGYGLSYTSFEYSDFSVVKQPTPGKLTNEYEISVKVTNTGTVAGKEVAQIYLQKPYTEYDEYYGIEKSAVELVEFGKTEILKPNESQILTITVEEESLTTYDAYGERTFIIEAGDYYFTVGKDAHDAINNIIDYKSEGLSLVQQPCANGITGLGDKSLVAVATIQTLDATTYATSTAAMDNHIKGDATRITNQFEMKDTVGTSTNILDYVGATSGFSYVTRSAWADTTKLGFDKEGNCLNNQVKVTITEEMYQERKAAMADPEPDFGEYPTMGNQDSHLMLIDLRAYEDDDYDVSNDVPIEYDNEAWELLLDQLTWEEMVALLNNGLRLTGSIDSIAKPETIDFNGSVGLVTSYSSNSKINRGLAMETDDPDKGELICFYPSNGVCASTFNKELMYRYGEQWGEDSLWSGISGLYGMGINMHRSPYGGRNFEYYSEDPVLTGLISAETVKGAATKGMYCYLKHCVINDQETYRIGGYCWLTEQTMREIYLKPFEIAIKKGGANSVMTAEPALGLAWSGQQGFVKTVLREEFGMTGIAVSDFLRDIDGNILKGLIAGSDIPDGTDRALFDNISSTDGYGDLAHAMREATHHILYTVVQSNAMNGFSSSTRVVTIIPEWVTMLERAMDTVPLVYGGVLALLVVVAVGDLFVKAPAAKQEKKKAKK